MRVSSMLFVFTISLYFTGCVSVEEGLWKRALAQDRSQMYRFFLKQYPESKHAAQAKQRLQLSEQREWKLLGQYHYSKAYLHALMSNPESKYYDKIEAALEATTWAETLQLDSPAAYKAFLILYPHSQYSPVAQKQLHKAELELNRLAKAGSREILLRWEREAPEDISNDIKDLRSGHPSKIAYAAWHLSQRGAAAKGALLALLETDTHGMPVVLVKAQPMPIFVSPIQQIENCPLLSFVTREQWASFWSTGGCFELSNDGQEFRLVHPRGGGCPSFFNADLPPCVPPNAVGGWWPLGGKVLYLDDLVTAAIKSMGARMLAPAVPVLVAALKNATNKPIVAQKAALALGFIGDKRAVPALIDALFIENMPNCIISKLLSHNSAKREDLSAAFRQLVGSTNITKETLEQIKERCERVRKQIDERHRRFNEQLRRFNEQLRRFGSVRAASVRALGEIGGPRAIKAVIYAGLHDLSHAVVLAAAETLKSVRGRENVVVLIDGLDDVRGAYTWLQQETLPEDVGRHNPELYARDDFKQMQMAIIDALTSITNQRFGADVEQWRMWWQRNMANTPKTGD